jgi:4-amino-4-deoxy-L-arabinose transferase-like glycosyltransferase
LQPRDNPWMVTAYPFLYYAVVAVVQRVLSIFGTGPVWLFLGVRFFSVVLLAASLVVTYKVLRELRWQKARALLLTAIVAFFPLTSFVSSSVQPDNLTLLLVLLCWFLALRLRRANENSRRLSLLLGLTLGALLVTKYHVFMVTAFAVLATLVTEGICRKRTVRSVALQFVLLVLPSVLFFMVQLWVVWGGERITGGNLHSASTGLLTGIKSALYDYYRGGPAWVSWWGTFGWMDASLVIWSPGVQSKVWRVLSLLTLLVLLLVFLRVVQVLVRLLRLAKRARWRLALRLTFSNPLIVSHLMFSAFMVLLYALTDNAFFAQGRHWFPLTMSGFVLVTDFAPRVLPRRKLQAAVSTMLMIALLVYCAVGGYFSLQTITSRYYPAVTSSAMR